LVENGADINALRMSASHGYLEVVKCLVEHGSDIHTNNVAFKYSAVEGHLDVVKYLIIDCNMLINKKTLDYLKVSCLSEIVNIINARDLHQQLENNLNKPIINDKIKIK
jgi:ankyrin repeat protein